MRTLALLALLAGCPSASTGTIDLGLATAPGSALLDTVIRLRVALSNPVQIVEAARGPNGFAIALDVEANGEVGFITVEGFDANGALVAGGQSPAFGVTAINARIVVYMAAPLSLARAPVSLMPARANVAGGTLPYGAIFAGGHDAAGAPNDALAIYNAYDHSLVGGKPMPAPRDGIVVATAPSGAVYLYGGRDAAGNPTGTYWLYDSNAPRGGNYVDGGDHPGLPRADALAIPIGVEKYVITGTPPLDMQGATIAARADIAGFAPTTATFVTPTGVRTALGLDTSGRFVRFHDDMFELFAISRLGGAVGGLPDGRFIVVGGGTPDEANDIVVIDTTGAATLVADALSAPHTDAQVAVTSRYIVIVGGGRDTEVLDASTLAHVTSLAPIDGKPFALPNDQVLVVDSTNGELSLFTPPPPGV